MEFLLAIAGILIVKRMEIWLISHRMKVTSNLNDDVGV